MPRAQLDADFSGPEAWFWVTWEKDQTRSQELGTLTGGAAQLKGSLAEVYR